MPEEAAEIIDIKPVNFTSLPMPEPEHETTEPQTPILRKIQEIDVVRKSVKKEIDKIVQTATGEAGVDEQKTPIIIEDDSAEELQDTQLLIKTLEEGKKSGEIPTKDQVGITRALRDIVRLDIENLNLEIKSNEDEIDQILKILEQKLPIWVRWNQDPANPSAHLKGKEKKEVDILNKKLAQLRNKKQELEAKRSESGKKLDDLNYEKKDATSKAIKEQISLLQIQYQELLSTILSDKSTVNEVLKAYISSTLEPQIVKLVKDLSYKEPEARGKIEKLQKAIEKIQSGDFADNISRKELLDEFVTDYDFRPIYDELMLLQTGEEYRIVNLFVTTLFQQDIDSFRPKLGEHEYNFREIQSEFSIYEHTSYEPDVFRWGGSEYVNFTEHYGKMYKNSLLQDHIRPFIIMQSPSIYNPFKDKIDLLYKENHKQLLEKSLTDNTGDYIDQLIHYPEPDTIRNLVLISAARQKNYRTIHAISILKEITERKDWPDLLKETLEEYPELSLTEKVLKNFNPDFSMGYVIYPELSNSILDFALNMIKRYPDNKNLNSIAMESILKNVVDREVKKIDTLFASDIKIEIDENNWESLLLTYIQTQTQNHNYLRLSESSTEKINALFSDPKVRNFCLNEFRNLWISYLSSEKTEEMPLSLILMTEFIHECESAGPLNQIESLSSFIYDFRRKFSNEYISNDIKMKIFNNLLETEKRFNKERVSNDDRSEFYNISRDFLNIDADLFSDTLLLLNELTPPQLKLFLRDIFPLYRVMLILNSGNIHFLKEQARSFSDSIKAGSSSFEAHKQFLIEEIQATFKYKMGIVKTPNELTKEHLRSIKNISIYLGNISDRNPNKETILSFYLSLILNEKWSDFISGIDINPEELLISEKGRIIRALLNERKQTNILNPKNLGISQDDMLDFFRIFQQEEEKIILGDIETVDIKLGSVIINLQGLIDLDLYNNPLDKQRMEILINWGNKSINSTIAKMYQSLEKPDRVIEFSNEEEQIRQQILKIIQKNGLSLTPELLKQYFQDEMKPFAAIVNLLTYINQTNAQPEIEKLRQSLHPPQEIIEVFQKLGEDFKPTSGAMALSQDLNYLTNLVVKREGELKPEEIDLLRDYISKIREQVILLEEVYNKIKDKFISLRQGMVSRENPLLEEKFNQISAIVSAQTTQQTITSTMTHNLNTIIENIRECLSCSKGGSNNDTNLTFGDINKFFITSRSETQTIGSIADQIVFFEPITRADGSQEISFILDRVYGINTPIILENHINVILSKARQIKKRFPSIKLSVLITDAALSSSGASSDIFLTNLANNGVSVAKENVKVDVLRSVFGDHYIEFGGGSRTSGEREVNGIIITI